MIAFLLYTIFYWPVTWNVKFKAKQKNFSFFREDFLAGGVGIEPTYADLEAAVLPLYEPPPEITLTLIF